MRFQTAIPSEFIRAVHKDLQVVIGSSPLWKLGGLDSLRAISIPATDRIKDASLVAQVWMERPRRGKAICILEVATHAPPGIEPPSNSWRDEIVYSIRSFLVARVMPRGVVPATGSTAVKLRLDVPTITDETQDTAEHASLYPGEIERITAFVQFLEPALSEWAASGRLPSANGLANEFHKLAIRVYRDGMDAVGYPARRYLQKVRNDGGVAAAKSWLQDKKDDTPTDGFMKLVEHGLLEISLEAHVIKEQWSSLFSEDELRVARARLARYGYFDEPDETPRPDNALSEEVETFIEGKSSKVIVNVYERDPKARALCIERHGATCCICGFSFAEFYGSELVGYIHVHHLCSLASINGEYEVNPETDLRPVCPNCHAVIHRTKTVRTIEQVRSLIRATAEQKLASPESPRSSRAVRHPSQ